MKSCTLLGFCSDRNSATLTHKPIGRFAVYSTPSSTTVLLEGMMHMTTIDFVKIHIEPLNFTKIITVT